MHFRAYTSAADMIEELRRAEAEADAAVQPWQAAVRVGDCAWRVWDTGSGLLTIYYEIIAQHPEDPPLKPNRRLVRGYSTAEPEGEPGTVHVASFNGLLTRSMFDTAKLAGWPPLL